MAEETAPTETEELESTPGEPGTPPSAEAATETPPAEESPAQLKERVEGMSKLVQKLSQTVNHLERDKAKQEGELNAVQQAKLEQAKQDLRKVTTDLKNYADSSTDDDIATKLARTVAAQAEKMEELERRLNERPATSQSPQAREEESWTATKASYPHVDLRVLKSEWTKAIADASKSRVVKNAEARLEQGTMSKDAFDGIVESAAQDLYHPRVAALNTAKTPPTATGPAPTTANGRRSVPMNTAANSQAPVEFDEEWEQIKKISREMDKG